jgi:hypothetical protein
LIALLVLWFSSGKSSALLFISLYSLALYASLNPDLCPLSILW